MLLTEWQTTQKSLKNILYNCSECTHLNDEWVPFPIGIGWKFINYKSDIETFHTGKHEQLVLCAINETTDRRRRKHYTVNRRKILQTLGTNQIQNQNIHANRYFKELSNYKFIISPEGNGIDCHRHYEALIAGCIPIVEDHPLIREKYKGCPVLYTKDYSEITESYLLQKYEEMLKSEYDFSKLLLSTYSESEQQEIKRNGNYWALRLSKNTWYN